MKKGKFVLPSSKKKKNGDEWNEDVGTKKKNLAPRLGGINMR